MGAYLNTPKTDKHPVLGESQPLEYVRGVPRVLVYASTEMQGWRMTMEDARISWLHQDAQEAHFGVFDGHGGSEVAKFVERHFTNELLANPNYRSGQFEQALKECFLRMDTLLQMPDGQKELIRIQRNLPDDYKITVSSAESMAGCTAVVALVKNGQLFVANAGDSRCVLAKNRQAVPMSFDHKPDLQEERKRIMEAGGSVEEGRVMGNINLSRSIGDFEYKRSPGLPPERQMITAFPDVKVEPLSRDADFLVLACDGIWDMVSNEECVNFVYQGLDEGKSLSQIVESLLDRCLAPDIATHGGLGCDNMTCTIVRFRHS